MITGDMERRVRMWPIQVDRRCLKDGCLGMMIATGYSETYGERRSIQHKCSACGRTDRFDRKYPYIDYEAVSLSTPEDH